MTPTPTAESWETLLLITILWVGVSNIEAETLRVIRNKNPLLRLKEMLCNLDLYQTCQLRVSDLNKLDKRRFYPAEQR